MNVELKLLRRTCSIVILGGIAKIRYKSKFAFAIFALPLLVFAATTWPFVAGVISPGITFTADRDMNFSVAQALPIRVMGVSVRNVKRGDTLRVMYADGMYDFEVSYDCSVALSQCLVENPKRVDGPNASPQPSRRRIDEARTAAIEAQEQNCGQHTAEHVIPVTIPTGFWATTYTGSVDLQIFGTSATWQIGPTVTLLISIPAMFSACR